MILKLLTLAIWILLLAPIATVGGLYLNKGTSYLAINIIYVAKLASIFIISAYIACATILLNLDYRINAYVKDQGKKIELKSIKKGNERKSE